MVFLSAAVLPTAAQQQAPPAAPASEKTEQTQKTELPFLLFVPQHPAQADKREIEFDALLREPMREMLRNRFRVLTFGMHQDFVKRALLEHQIPVSDLPADSSLITPETFRHLAYAAGARYLLMLGTSFDADSARIDMRFQENVTPKEWRTLLAEQIAVETSVGKKRLKTNQLIDLTVDAVADRMGIPSDLSKSLNRKVVASALDKLNKQGKTAKPEPKKTPASSDDIAQETPPDTPPAPPSTRNTPPSAAKTALPTRNADTPKNTANANAGKHGPTATETPSGKPPTNAANTPGTPSGADNAILPFTSDTGPGRAAPPKTVAPPTPTERTDNEAMATHFRQTGDLANVITSLRRAINEHPRDTALRRQLIQAYEDRGLADTALAEADRALQFAPKDASLLRLRGDTLLARGDVEPAMKAYREAVQIDPNDVTAQVALGDALLAGGQYDEAVAAYHSAAVNAPKSPLPHRRLARALAGRAGSDAGQYAASLDEIKKARSLTPTTDTETYLDDYIALMRLMEVRLNGMLDELQDDYQASVTGKRTAADSQRAAQDMKARAEAAADYLENVPPAAGQDATHASYLQGAALLLQAIGLYRDYLNKGSTHTEEDLKSTRVDALRALSAADKRLHAVRDVTDTPHNSGGNDTRASTAP